MALLTAGFIAALAVGTLVGYSIPDRDLKLARAEGYIEGRDHGLKAQRKHYEEIFTLDNLALICAEQRRVELPDGSGVYTFRNFGAKRP